MPKQNDLLMDISILYRSTQKYYDKKLMSLDLTYAQLPILIAIYENEGISMQAIASDGGYDKGTITKNVQKLVSLGYVEVRSSLKDKRAKELYTTDKAKQMMNKIYGIRREWWKHIIKTLPKEKLDEFSKLYGDMAENAKVYADKDDDLIQFFAHKKVSLNDFQDKVSTTLYTAGCNFRCPHCSKTNLIFLHENQVELSLEDIKAYLEKRKKILDAVCFMEPEPLMHKKLKPFLEYVKSLGYLVKIQTNGSYPERLKEWVELGLIDYVCLDIKNAPSLYGQTIGIASYDIGPVEKTLNYLRSNFVDYEISTTLVKEFHTLESIHEMACWLKGVRNLVFSSYQKNNEGIRKDLHGFSTQEMVEIKKEFKKYIEHVEIKGESYDEG